MMMMMKGKAMLTSLTLTATLAAAAASAAATTDRAGEVWSRLQEDQWHAEMGYQREVRCHDEPTMPTTLRSCVPIGR